MREPLHTLLEPLKPREVEVLRLMADGLSNEEIAAQLFVAVTTVRWHNRQLYSKLGVHSRTLAVARARALGLLDNAPVADSAPPTSSHLPPSNLPAPTNSFVGREREVAKARQLLGNCRLLTLTGPGGTGKTRLALQVAEAVHEYYADGVWFVPLAAVTDPKLAPAAFADVLKVPRDVNRAIRTTLVKHLQDKHALLVVDNFEHLTAAAPLLSQMLADAPRLKLLVTSRELLRLNGEQEYSVPPLTVPERDAVVSVPELWGFEAARLFVERTQATQPDFTLTQENAAAVAEICVRLDGLPLALELAAARIKLLGPHELLARLRSGFGSLGQGPRDAPARQRTLQATIAWSTQLLSVEEKQLLNRLAVFRGGWTLDAMEAVCGPDLALDTIEGLQSLLDKSLVQPIETSNQETSNRELRFRMLETVREVAWLQLPAAESFATQRQHRDWFLQLAQRGRPKLHGKEGPLWFTRLHQDEDNLHLALAWCLAQPQEHETGLRMTATLMNYWHVHGTFGEGRAWLLAFLAQTEHAKTVDRARALNSAGILAYRQGDYAEVVRLCGEALEISEMLGEREPAAHALHFLAHTRQIEGQSAEAAALLARSMDLYLAAENRLGYAESQNCLGDLYRQLGSYQEAEELLRQSLAEHRELDHLNGVAVSLYNLGNVLCRQNDIAQATACFSESFALGQLLNDGRTMSNTIAGFATVAMLRGQYIRAASLLGAADKWFLAKGYRLEPPDQRDRDRMVGQIRQHLGEADYLAAWRWGQQMSLDQAAAYAEAAN